MRFEKEANVRYKLKSQRGLIGGLQHRAMLVSFNTLKKVSRARTRALNIGLCCKTELKPLQHQLQEWRSTGR